jgi:hypothetical protein
MLYNTWGFHGSDYEECRLLGYKNPVRTSQETHYVSATEPSRLMLCKIWGFHGRDYEECRLLGYKTPVRTSQETHYISATVPSRLMLCKIWGFHGSDYEERRVAHARTDVSEDLISSTIRVERIRELDITLAVSSNCWELCPATRLVYVGFLMKFCCRLVVSKDIGGPCQGAPNRLLHVYQSSLYRTLCSLDTDSLVEFRTQKE